MYLGYEILGIQIKFQKSSLYDAELAPIDTIVLLLSGARPFSTTTIDLFTVFLISLSQPLQFGVQFCMFNSILFRTYVAKFQEKKRRITIHASIMLIVAQQNSSLTVV
ncbi:hypothetical protein R3W88_001596 [Solanum pinnatisectum]|uniref:Uncharacterized protein n=1 Tax=Solanum pinnatisectum TaxID=50273 RepID=A0AAV9MLJ7_9SOLN|nr:hypothetical protein R3W88_001596 [Solanum pinnatisectum]